MTEAERGGGEGAVAEDVSARGGVVVTEGAVGGRTGVWTQSACPSATARTSRVRRHTHRQTHTPHTTHRGTHAQTHTHTRTDTHTHRHIHTRARTHPFSPALVAPSTCRTPHAYAPHIHTSAHTHACMHAFMHGDIHSYIHASLHPFIHTCILKYIVRHKRT